MAHELDTYFDCPALQHAFIVTKRANPLPQPSGTARQLPMKTVGYVL
jgi:hypothetical protein